MTDEERQAAWLAAVGDVVLSVADSGLATRPTLVTMVENLRIETHRRMDTTPAIAEIDSEYERHRALTAILNRLRAGD